MVPDELKNVPVETMDEHQLQKWSGSLQLAVIFNRACFFVASKLRDFQKSRINILYYVFSFIFLVILTVTVFSYMNYALYKINPNNFKISFSPGALSFFYYSINSFFHGGIADFYPVSATARLVNTLEGIFSFLLIVIVFSLMMSIRSKRHTEDVDTLVKNIHSQGQMLETVVQSEYQMSIDQAIKELDRIKAGLIKVIYYLSSNIE